MVRSLFFAALGVLLFTSPSFAKSGHTFERTRPWNAETSDLQADTSIVYGKLSNGLRYAIKDNQRPQNQVFVRLVFDFGSAAETEEEQGLAHFIEHMAFNGSTNVAEGEMVKMLERLGLSFGADTNASTGFTQTQYKLDLPKADPALISKSLFLMRETASELSFTNTAIEKEKGVILAEMRQRDTPGLQVAKANNAFFYPDSYFSNRFAIGKKEVIESARTAQLRSLYTRYYRPERARLVIVGPINPTMIEREIARKFSSWKGAGTNPPKFDRCSFDLNRKNEAQIFAHPEISESISFERLFPDKKRPDNFEKSLLQLKLAIGGGIISDRMSRRSRKEDLPYLGSNLVFQTGFCDKYARVGMAMSGKDGSWETLTPLAEQMVRQAAIHGFEQSEIDDQIRRFDTSFENAAKAINTRNSAGIASELVGAVDDIVAAPDQTLLLWLQLRPFLTRPAINAEFSKWFGGFDQPLIFLTSKSKDSATPSQLKQSFIASAAVPVAAPEKRNKNAFAYTDFGAPGKIAADTQITDLGIRTIRFENGVKLNLKKTNFENNRIRYAVRIAGGDLFFGKQTNLAALFNGAYVSGGLEAHDIDDLRSILSGTTVGADLGANDDSFGSDGAVAPKDLDLQLQLIAAFLTKPAYREEALRLYRRPLPEIFERLDATPASALSVGAGRVMNDNDTRFSISTLEDLQKPDLQQLKATLGDALTRNALEIALVGDIDEQKAIDAVAKTLGALPKRAETFDNYDEARNHSWSSKRGTFEFSHAAKDDQLAWSRRWLTTDDRDYKTEQQMVLLSRVVSLRLVEELREKLGATYSPSASSNMSDVYRERGVFAISISGNPKDIPTIEASVDAIMTELLAAPISADMFERARKPVLESYADWRKSNSTWIGIASIAQSKPDRLDRFRINEAQFRAITRDDLWNAAKRFLGKPADFTFRAIPASSLPTTQMAKSKE